jgi:hypothetical protein
MGIMSALGHKRTSQHVQLMSTLPPKADIEGPLSWLNRDFQASKLCI